MLPLTVNGSGLGGPSISTVNVISVPADTYLSEEDMARLRGPIQTIEHAPQLEQAAPEPIAPIDRAFEPRNERERELLAELEALSPEELLARAKEVGFVDVDD